MIPVQLQPEPADFNVKVRQPGQNWLAKHGIALNAAPPKAGDLPNYWTRSNKALWDAYSGVCAYLAIYIDWATGAASTDHYIAKSKNAGEAYEWNNYRLSCLGSNRNKGEYDDVLDPIGLQPETFVLDLTTGEIRPNPSSSKAQRLAARKTIARLKLDSPEHNKMRAKHFTCYLKGKDESALKEFSPFVWYEAKRQGLL